MIYPVPQKMNLGGECIEALSFTAEGEYKAYIEDVLKDNNISVSDSGFVVNAAVFKNERTSYLKELSRLCDEKYFISIKEDGACIECSSRRGIFRAVNTLIKLYENGELKAGNIEDYPLFIKRGYIEGFYGKTWENSKRVSVMKLMAKNGMNTFYYGPKDDIYHREKWSEMYPENELSQLKALFELSKKSEIDFYWCVGPGLTYRYTSQEDFTLLINKLKSIYDIGVRGFGLLLDDIPWDFRYSEDKEAYPDIVSAHIELVNKVYGVLKAIDSKVTLTVCPTQYSGDENGYYISRFGNGIPADVSVFWTGEEICSRVLTVREADELFRSSSHKPLFWDNFPVNDCEMYKEMHLGAVIGRDKELYRHCEGLISNVMEYAECSKIPLLTVADYLWNPISYNSENSLNNAHKVILGDKSELFGYFADHLGVSCLSKYSSSFMSETLSNIWFLLSTGQKDEGLAAFKAYNEKMYECACMLKDTTVPIFSELTEWSEKFTKCCNLLDLIYETVKEPSKANKETLQAYLKEYNSDSVILTGFCLRESAEKALLL